MANSSDWIAALDRSAEDQGRAAPSPLGKSGWIAALGLGEAQTPGGFCAISPFGDSGTASNPQPAPEQEPGHETSAHASPEEDAYMRGYAEGHAEAMRAGQDALAQEQARYRELRLAFRALDAAAMDALAQDLNATVLSLCEQVVGEYALDSEALARRCEAAAQRLGAGPNHLTLYLHPETRARLNADLLPGWTIEDDAALAPGALRLISQDGAMREGPDDWHRAFAEGLGG